MTPKEAESGAATASPTISPGRLIANAREALSIGPADLAARLRLDTKIVKALERDDFDALPEPTFVKGYIRSIAKELEIDADTVLSAYAAATSVEPPSLADFSSRAPDQIGINSGVVKAVTYGLVGILVVLIALWWRGNYTETAEDTAAGATADAIAAADAPVPLPYTYDVVEHAEDSWRNPPLPDEDPVPPAAGDEPAPAPVSADGHRLSIATDSEAWVEVYDRGGERLYFGMARAGQSVELDGHAYYRMVLGNTDSIRLEFDGTAIDLAPHSNEGVAQLALGGDAPAGGPQ